MAAAPKAAKGSAPAMPAAQQAAIGARICTAKANMTIGRNFRNRRRISTALLDPRDLITSRVRSRDQVPNDILWVGGNFSAISGVVSVPVSPGLCEPGPCRETRLETPVASHQMATQDDKIPIISQIALILNNRC